MTPAELDRSMALELLRGHGCPACVHAVAAVERHLGWFMAESYAFDKTRDRLRASLGFCPGHTRRILTRPAAASRVTRVYPGILAAARVQLSGTANAAPDLSRCPACASGEDAERRAVELITGLLDDTAIAGMFADGGGF